MFGIGPELYLPIYYTVISFLSLLVFSQYENYADERLDEPPKPYSLGVIMFTIAMVLFIGLRPVSGKYFVDMATYDEAYNVLSGSEYIFVSGEDTNLLFDNLFRFMASREIPVKYFFCCKHRFGCTSFSWRYSSH